MSLNKVKSIISAPKAKPKVKVINNIVFILSHHLSHQIQHQYYEELIIQFEEGANCSYLFSGHCSFIYEMWSWWSGPSMLLGFKLNLLYTHAHSILRTVSMSKLMSTSHMVTSVSARDSRSVSRVAPLWCSWSRSSPRPPPPPSPRSLLSRNIRVCIVSVLCYTLPPAAIDSSLE